MTAGSGAALVAAGALGLALALAVPGGWHRAQPGAPARWAARAGGAVLVAGGLVAAVDPRTAVLLVLASGVALGGGAGWRRRVAERRALGVAVRVRETCDLLAGELAAGSPPGRALSRAAGEWPDLCPAAEAFELGASVPEALRALGECDGAGDLELVAAAWEVSHRSGEGLASAVAAVADELRAEEATRRVVGAELASARATGRLVAGLPLLALAIGSGAGGSPVGFLVTTPLGLGCLAAGLALLLTGLAWIDAIARGVRVGR